MPKGKIGLVSAERNKLVALQIIGFNNLDLRFYYQSFLRRWWANYIHPFGHRREFLVAFHRCHKFGGSFGESGTVDRLPADIVDEGAL